MLAERNAATGQITRTYTWGLSGLISDRGTPDANGTLTLSRYYVFSPSGSTEYLLDGTGQILWGQGRWSPYGNYLYARLPDPPGVQRPYVAKPGEQIAPPTPFAFKGQWGAYTDTQTGLIRMGVRDYAPNLGRFVSRDPSGYAGGVNLYGYCCGDPVNFTDVDGEDPVTGGLVGAGIGAGASFIQAYYFENKRGDELRDAVIRGTVKGAISGALIGTLGPAAGACESLLMAAGTGAASGMAENIVEQGYNVYDGKQDGFKWKSFAKDGVIGAVTGAVMHGMGKLCFDPETAVQVPDTKHTQLATSKNGVVVRSTTKPIKSMQAGDKVFARDERTGKTVIAQVKQVFKRTSDHLITIEFATKAGKTAPTVDTLKTTRQHPFYVDGKGWLPAGGLAIGNAIVTRAGPRLFVKSIHWQRRPQGYTVYNFEVEPLGGKAGSGGDSGKNAGKFTHSYFVGNALGGAWVHNGQYGRIQSRINLQRDPTAKEGIDHVLTGHLRPGGKKSQFGINADKIKQLLQSKPVVNSPVTPLGSGRYLRTVDVGRDIGWDMSNGNAPTQWLTVITNNKGNLLTAFPGK